MDEIEKRALAVLIPRPCHCAADYICSAHMEIIKALRAVATETAEKCAGMAFDSGEGIGEHISDSIRARFGLA